jgi:pyruvate dehydrogenase E1 component
MRCRGFMMGGTAGRTTLAGEGLQHQDGHTHLLMSVVPTIRSYDPAFAYEIATIIRDGIRRMYVDGEHGFYYLTICNENYPQPQMPEGAAEGILKGLYSYRRSQVEADADRKVHLFGSGTILREVLRAQEILGERYDVPADVWSATSYNLLRRDCLQVERWNMLHADQEPRRSYLQELLENENGVYVAASDYLKAVPDQVSRWIPGGLFTLGTDGFGRSENRESLRRHFEVDAEHVAVAALYALARNGKVETQQLKQAIKDLEIDPEVMDPMDA